jgi:hypothetical protein
VNTNTGGSGESSSAPVPPYGWPGYGSVSPNSGPAPSEPAAVSSSPAGAGDAFDWVDAALGAGVALALVGFGGAALLTVRRRTAITPASTS